MSNSLHGLHQQSLDYIQLQSTLVISRNRRDPLKNFEISVLRHIRFVVLRKKQFEQPNFTNYNIVCLLIEICIDNILEKEQFLLFFTIFCNLILDFCVKTKTRFSLRDKRLFEITEVEITRVDCTLESSLL